MLVSPARGSKCLSGDTKDTSKIPGGACVGFPSEVTQTIFDCFSGLAVKASTSSVGNLGSDSS